MLQKVGNAQLNVFCTALSPNIALTRLQLNLFLVGLGKFLVLPKSQLTRSFIQQKTIDSIQALAELCILSGTRMVAGTY